MADTILLVARLELICLRNTARLLQTLGKLEDLQPKVRLVINQDGAFDSAIHPAKAAEYLKFPISWTIPNSERECNKARSRGVPLRTIAPKCPAQRVIDQIAKSLLESPYQSPPKPQTTNGLHRLAAMF